MFQRFFIFLFLIKVLAAANGQTRQPEFLSDHNKKWVDSVFSTLTLDEKIGQLLMPRGNYSGKPHPVDSLRKWVNEYKIGGIVFFASGPATQAKITNELQSLSRVPLLIGQDFEWGVGMRLDSADRFPYAVTLGAMQGQNDLIEAMGRVVARQCKNMGVHINYAPVVDINNNPNNPVINFRSFGSDKDKVTAAGLAYMKGMQSQRILCTAKHFPGHGDTDTDSHYDLPLISHNRERLLNTELHPFRALISEGLSGVMTAHLNIPALEPSPGLASTFSQSIIFKLLREEMGFRGLTFTDAMEMQGAVKNFPKGEAMVRALLAGNDLLETFMDVGLAVSAIREAVKKGRIPMQALDFKVKKILMAKSYVGLDNYTPINIVTLSDSLNTIEADVLNHKMAGLSFTCLKNEGGLLPVRDLTQRIALLSVDAESDADEFYRIVSNYVPVTQLKIDKTTHDTLVDKVLAQAENYDLILCTFHLSDIRASKNYGLRDANKKVMSRLAANPKAVITILGNPFILGKVPELSACKTLLMGYQQTRYTESTAAQVIFGAMSPAGRLPVAVNENFPFNMGNTWQPLGRLSYGVPELVNISRTTLAGGIDSLMRLGINKKAFPGGEILVAKDGMVIFSKAYGYHTYRDAENAKQTEIDWSTATHRYIDDAMDNPLVNANVPQKTTKKVSIPFGKNLQGDIYDLASVTKISTSALAVMRLMSDKKFSLDEKLGTYYPTFTHTNKDSLRMRDLLTHRAGLKEWIPFWKNCVDTVATMKKALELHPELESEYLVTIKKPFFLCRLFGKKAKKTINYSETVTAKPALWEKLLAKGQRVWKEGIFSERQTEEFSVKIHDSLFLHKNYRKEIIRQIALSPVYPGQGYLYSDLHYYLYPEITERLTGLSFESYLQQTYSGLGAFSLRFRPDGKFPGERIVPTEYDSLFRKVLIHGFVHDEGAAMMDGISGHAGLFGSAGDLAKLMQMYLQNGYYGGKRFIDSSVVAMCTAYQFADQKNRRGIGFDKKDFNPDIKNAPALSSPLSFGHSGYTGTYAWVDPKYNLVYIFLSNRVYPTRNNTMLGTLNLRPAIGDHIINCIMAGAKPVQPNQK